MKFEKDRFEKKLIQKHMGRKNRNKEKLLMYLFIYLSKVLWFYQNSLLKYLSHILKIIKTNT